MATSLHTTPGNVRLRGMMPLTAEEWRDGEEEFGPEVKVNADKTGYQPFMCIICGMLSPPDLAQPFVCARGECKEGIWPKNSLKPFSQQEDLIVNVLHVMVDRIDKDLLRAKPFKHYNQLQWLCQLAVPTTIEGVHFYREFNIVSANKQQDPLAYLKDFKKSIRVVIQNDEKLSTLASHLLALESDVKENAARVAEIKRLEFEVARLEREMKDGAQPAAVAKVARMETAVAESERLLKEQAKELQSLKDRLANATKAKVEAEKLARKRTGLSSSTPNESTIKLADELELKVTALLLGEDGEAAGTSAITAGRSAVEAINTEGVFLGWIATLVAVQARGIGNLDAELRSFLANFADEEAATTWRGWYGVPLGISSAVWGASSSVVRSASSSAYGFITSFSNARAAGGTSRSIWRRAWDSTKEHGDHFAKNAFLAPYAIGRQAWKGVWADGTEMGLASRVFSVPLVPFVFAVLTPIAAISALASGVLTPFGLGWGGKTVL